MVRIPEEEEEEVLEFPPCCDCSHFDKYMGCIGPIDCPYRSDCRTLYGGL